MKRICCILSIVAVLGSFSCNPRPVDLYLKVDGLAEMDPELIYGLSHAKETARFDEIVCEQYWVYWKNRSSQSYFKRDTQTRTFFIPTSDAGTESLQPLDKIGICFRDVRYERQENVEIRAHNLDVTDTGAISLKALLAGLIEAGNLVVGRDRNDLKLAAIALPTPSGGWGDPGLLRPLRDRLRSQGIDNDTLFLVWNPSTPLPKNVSWAIGHEQTLRAPEEELFIAIANTLPSPAQKTYVPPQEEQAEAVQPFEPGLLMQGILDAMARAIDDKQSSLVEERRSGWQAMDIQSDYFEGEMTVHFAYYDTRRQDAEEDVFVRVVKLPYNSSQYGLSFDRLTPGATGLKIYTLAYRTNSYVPIPLSFKRRSGQEVVTHFTAEKEDDEAEILLFLFDLNLTHLPGSSCFCVDLHRNLSLRGILRGLAKDEKIYRDRTDEWLGAADLKFGRIEINEEVADKFDLDWPGNNLYLYYLKERNDPYEPPRGSLEIVLGERSLDPINALKTLSKQVQFSEEDLLKLIRTGKDDKIRSESKKISYGDVVFNTTIELDIWRKSERVPIVVEQNDARKSDFLDPEIHHFIRKKKDEWEAEERNGRDNQPVTLDRGIEVFGDQYSLMIPKYYTRYTEQEGLNFDFKNDDWISGRGTLVPGTGEVKVRMRVRWNEDLTRTYSRQVTPPLNPSSSDLNLPQGSGTIRVRYKDEVIAEDRDRLRTTLISHRDIVYSVEVSHPYYRSPQSYESARPRVLRYDDLTNESLLTIDLRSDLRNDIAHEMVIRNQSECEQPHLLPQQVEYQRDKKTLTYDSNKRELSATFTGSVAPRRIEYMEQGEPTWIFTPVGTHPDIQDDLLVWTYTFDLHQEITRKTFRIELDAPHYQGPPLTFDLEDRTPCSFVGAKGPTKMSIENGYLSTSFGHDTWGDLTLIVEHPRGYEVMEKRACDEGVQPTGASAPFTMPIMAETETVNLCLARLTPFDVFYVDISRNMLNRDKIYDEILRRAQYNEGIYVFVTNGLERQAGRGSEIRPVLEEMFLMDLFSPNLYEELDAFKTTLNEKPINQQRRPVRLHLLLGDNTYNRARADNPERLQQYVEQLGLRTEEVLIYLNDGVARRSTLHGYKIQDVQSTSRDIFDSQNQ